MKRLIALVILGVFLSGCATEDQQAKTEGAGLGALGGGALGALIGGLVGGGRGAAIGGGAGLLTGAIGGYVYADHITKRRQELAGKENDLDARIAFARGLNQDTEEYNKRLAADLKSMRADVARLDAQKSQEESQKQALNEKKEQLGAKVKDADKQLALADEQLKDLKNFRASQTKPSKELDGEIKKLESTLAQLRTNTTELAALNQRI